MRLLIQSRKRVMIAGKKVILLVDLAQRYFSKEQIDRTLECIKEIVRGALVKNLKRGQLAIYNSILRENCFPNKPRKSVFLMI